jgi:hypothetical protein
MKPLWLLPLAAAPLAILTARESLDFGADVTETPPVVVKLQNQATLTTHREAVATLKQLDGWATHDLRGLGDQPPDSPLAPVGRSLAAWNAAKNQVEAFLHLAASQASRDVDALRALQTAWESFQRQLATAKLVGSEPMATFAVERSAKIRQEIERLNAESEALSAGVAARDAFSAGRYEDSLARARLWLSAHAPNAPAPLVEEIKALAARSEFHIQRERSRGRLKAAASAAEQEAVLVAFLERFMGEARLDSSERAVLNQCQRHLDKLRAEIAAAEQLRLARETVRKETENLPSRFEDRLARAAEIADRHPLAAVRTVLQDRVRQWIEEALPEKQWSEPPDVGEAETTDGRVLRGYFRKVATADGEVGYKRYDTAAQRDRPTVDVGTWLAKSLVSPPGPSVPKRLVQAYHDARKTLLDSPTRKASWEAFAAVCERLQAEYEAYRAKPGALETPLSFRPDGELARRVASSAALLHLQTIWADHTP